jgi:hypothetical protein
MGDTDSAGTWMTYTELAVVRGIKRSGAVRLVQRYGWRRQPGNDGMARVLVPHDQLDRRRGTNEHEGAHLERRRASEGVMNSTAASAVFGIVAGVIVYTATRSPLGAVLVGLIVLALFQGVSRRR